MILLFLGSWRSTLIITISIPLSVLASIICLSAIGETINIMTLGGLALAVGILVDDATVAIENINWHLEQGKDVEAAILDGAHQIAVPALVSTLCICVVFVPMFLLSGVSRFLFVPLAEAVVFAMLASYVLSRTLVPTLAKYWLHKHVPEHAGGRRAPALCSASSAASSAASRRCATATTSCWAPRCTTASRFTLAFMAHRRDCVPAAAVARPRFLSERRCRPGAAAPARPQRHSGRGDRQACAMRSKPGSGR